MDDNLLTTSYSYTKQLVKRSLLQESLAAVSGMALLGVLAYAFPVGAVTPDVAMQIGNYPISAH